MTDLVLSNWQEWVAFLIVGFTAGIFLFRGVKLVFGKSIAHWLAKRGKIKAAMRFI